MHASAIFFSTHCTWLTLLEQSSYATRRLHTFFTGQALESRPEQGKANASEHYCFRQSLIFLEGLLS
jgi:hypothetical protein